MKIIMNCKMFFFAGLIVSSLAMTAAPAAPEMPELTEEQLMEWQQEIDKEINNFVGTLSPEEQKQFHKDVEELTKVMEEMSEEELVQFIEGAFPEEVAAPEAEPVREEPAVVTPEKKPVVEEKPTKEIDKAIQILNNLITRTERFIRSTQRMPELPVKIKTWAAEDAIKEWQVGQSWNTLKASIEELDQRFHELQALDPRTNKYRYIDDLIKHETLYNNLTKLSNKLTKHEPDVQAPKFALDQISEETETAIQEVLGGFTEALFTTNMLTEIDAIIAKYGPRAKELTAEEEKEKKRAIEASKKPITPSATREIGRKKGAGAGAGGAEGGYGGGDYGYRPTPGGFDYGTGGGSGGAGGADGAERGGATQEGGAAGQPKKEGKEEKKEGKGEKPAEMKEHPSAQPLMSNIEKYLAETESALEEGKLDKILVRKTIDKDSVKSLDVAQRKLNKAMGEIKAMDLLLKVEKTITTAQKGMYKERIKNTAIKYEQPLTRAATEIKKIQGKLSVDQQYAYKGGVNKDNLVSRTALEAIPDPTDTVNIDELLKVIEKFLKEAKDIAKTAVKHSAAPAA